MPSKPQKISSKNLKAFLDANKRVTRLTGSLERHILTRTPEFRDQSYLHPSDLIKSEWCALHAYHALTGNYVATQEKPTLRMQSIFDEGHAIHAKWQNWIAEMGYLYGVWEKNGERIWGTSMADAKYREVPVESKKHMIRGHADGWVKGLDEDFLIEIKSMGAGTIRMEAPSLLVGANGDLETAWRAIKQPFRSHMLQGQMYLHLTHLMVEEGLLESAPDEIVFIYELKANQDYKEFCVKYDPEYVTEIFENALDVVWAVENKRPPACNIDPVNGCKRCSTFREVTNV
ncbi:hypothetical protein UFOVP621_126 [uncultured Caudovirales phage]|uniref:Uncharacterized protein n=1 Tax=uncultured Caudovirales phage TaxID=2100421 RepID=A0A6J5N8D7_9CAUD|nr:hypothetical protein UFOVP621_126 [uncultured Caudovirales phage]